jgi:hypothetical protein
MLNPRWQIENVSSVELRLLGRTALKMVFKLFEPSIDR